MRESSSFAPILSSRLVTVIISTLIATLGLLTGRHRGDTTFPPEQNNLTTRNATELYELSLFTQSVPALYPCSKNRTFVHNTTLQHSLLCNLNSKKRDQITPLLELL